MSNAQGRTRIERDALGEVVVPAAALFGAQTVRSVAHLGFSSRTLGHYPDLIRALAQVKQAAARANLSASVLPRRLSRAIDVAADRLIADAMALEFPVDVLGGGGSIAINMNINEVLANLANEHLGGRRGTYRPIDPKQHVNASQSTADACHTAARLTILYRWKPLSAAIGALGATMAAKTRAYGSVRTLGRTCLRDAMPAPLGLLLGGYADLLARRGSDLRTALAKLHVVTLGGTVIGTGSGAPLAYRRNVVGALREIVDLPLRRHRRPADALQNSDDIAAISAQLALLAQGLIKIAQDLRLLSSGPQGGFGELVLPHIQQGSSFFGNKSNPIVPETVLQCAFQVLGADRAAQAAAERAELYLNVFDGQVAINVMDSMQMLTNALTAFDSLCWQGLKPDEERCAALAALTG